MNSNNCRRSLYFLVILSCAFAFLAMAAQIAQAQRSRLITLNDAIDIALENNIELQRFSNQVASSEVSVQHYIDMINASTITLEAMGAAQEEIRTILRTSHRLEPAEDDDFTIRNQADLTEAAASAMQTMTLLLGAVAAVSLVVGGIGIMNIMLVTVTERTREIGIRLSVGARSRDVLTQFLTEAVVLSLTGGIIGILLAFGTSFLLNGFTQIRALVSPGIVFLAFFFSGAVGVFFGFFPARKAASLNPIDALHYE